MKTITQVILIFLLTFPAFAFAGPKDCTVSRIKLLRSYFVESVGLKNAFKLLDAGNCVGALEQFEKIGKMGNLAAQNNAGMIYEEGLGVLQDDQRAGKWYRKAAERWLPESQYNLATIIFYTKINADNFSAFRPLPKPEKIQDVAAYREALMWSIAASENGHRMASDGVKRLSDALPASEVEAARNAARKWIKAK